MSKRRAKETLSDGDLLRLSRKGDEEAFLVLYRRHQRSVFRFALHMSGRYETAEEVTQEVFLAMIRNAGQYVEGHGSLQAYLIGMARNQVRQGVRGMRTVALEETNLRTGPWGDASERLVDEISRDQELRTLRAAILSLPPNYREVIVLCDLEGQDYTHAAIALGCPVGTVRSRLHRARGILEAKLRRRERCPA